VSDAGTLLHCRKAQLVVGIDQVVAAPHLTPNNRQLMDVTCHGKTTETSKEVLMFNAVRCNSFFKTINFNMLNMRKVN
jgi:hypothetical protein